MKLENTNQEILCRMKVIEKYWLEGGQHLNKECETNEQFAFLQSIGLPFKRQEDIQKFEDDLNDTKFKNTLVNFEKFKTYVKTHIRI